MIVKTRDQQFETEDSYTYFGTSDGKLGFHVRLVDGKVKIYFADTILRQEDDSTIRVIL